MSRIFLRLAGGVVVVAAFAASACHSGERSVSIKNSDLETPASIEEVTGFWRILARAEKGECLISLNRLPESGGYGVYLEACSIARLRGIVAWRPADGGFELLNSDQHVVVRFRKSDVDAFDGGDGRYRLERAPLI